MKRIVVINEKGDILATADYHGGGVTREPEDGGPTYHEFFPLRGQQVHVVEFPNEASSLEAILRFHVTHRVRLVRGIAQLEARNKKSSNQAPKRKGTKVP